MQAYWTLTRRELASFFLSLSGYIIIAAALLLMGLSFVAILVMLREPMPMPVTELFYRSYFFWLILLLTTPVITMRLFALEKFSGTYETLMTTPVSDLQVVAAKFTAAILFYALMWLPLLGCFLVVRHYTHDTAALDGGVVGGTFLGILLLGGVFISLGCFASALTRNQAIAAMISLGFGASVFLLGYLASHPPEKGSWQTQVLSYFDLFEQMRDFTRGVVDTRPVILLGSLTFFFVFLTLRIVESRRWK
ncbi:MAG: ABC transporter permease [Verrucomicrobia bacterium]|nr:ABC transporter permease [Verrucomicrobiota bacterium]